MLHSLDSYIFHSIDTHSRGNNLARINTVAISRHATSLQGTNVGKTTIYSDGACSGNPGPGGWAARILYADGTVREIGGFSEETTNNRMELQAVIEGLKCVGEEPDLTMVTDSEYVLKGITEWIHGWKRRGWRTAAKKPVLNQDLWRILDALNTPQIRWEYTRGHAGDPDNERCDEIAQAFSRGDQPELLVPENKP